jgi:hypothetical protein
LKQQKMFEVDKDEVRDDKEEEECSAEISKE